MKLLILAGGFGTRLRSVINDVPKALAPVGGLPFLQLQIEHWRSHGIDSFVFLLHHQSELIVNFLKAQHSDLFKDCEVNWLVEPTPMDTGGAVAFAIDQLELTGDFLVTNSDTWLGIGYEGLLQAPVPSMAVVQLLDVSRYGKVQINSENYVTSFKEKNSCMESGWINAGFYHLSAELFMNWNRQPFSLERISLPSWSSCGKLKAIPLQADFIDIGVPTDYFRFCRWIESGKKVSL
jgi:D-glycero-alpha-D-manno-heptose 1-phosphate guanylyltransferase